MGLYGWFSGEISRLRNISPENHPYKQALRAPEISRLDRIYRLQYSMFYSSSCVLVIENRRFLLFIISLFRVSERANFLASILLLSCKHNGGEISRCWCRDICCPYKQPLNQLPSKSCLTCVFLYESYL